MAAAFAELKPSSMTFLSAMGSASMAPAAMSSANSARIMRPLYGARYGSSARSGRSEVPFGRSVEPGLGLGVLTELELSQVQFPPHPEIARQAVERKAKGGRPVVFE